MAVTVRVKTYKRYSLIPSIIKNMRSESAQATYNFARGTAASARRRITVPYPPASLPGHPPHIRSGDLKRSIRTEKVSFGRHRVVVGAPYGAYVEYGTRHMAARPFFRPAVEEQKRLFKLAMRDVIHR